MSEDREYQAAEVDRRVANVIRLGTIAEVDLAKAVARVTLDEQWESDFLPWCELAGGALKSWRPPSVGDQVVVLSPSGDPGNGLIVRGLFSTAQPAPSDSATLTILAKWADGTLDQYEAASKTRTLSLPAGAHLVIQVGETTQVLVDDGKITVKAGSGEILAQDGKVTVEVGSSSILVQDGSIVVTGDAVQLGGSGGQAVARVGDHVNLTTGLIVSGSGKVSAA